MLVRAGTILPGVRRAQEAVHSSIHRESVGGANPVRKYCQIKRDINIGIEWAGLILVITQNIPIQYEFNAADKRC